MNTENKHVNMTLSARRFKKRKRSQKSADIKGQAKASDKERSAARHNGRSFHNGVMLNARRWSKSKRKKSEARRAAKRQVQLYQRRAQLLRLASQRKLSDDEKFEQQLLNGFERAKNRLRRANMYTANTAMRKNKYGDSVFVDENGNPAVAAAPRPEAYIFLPHKLQKMLNNVMLAKVGDTRRGVHLRFQEWKEHKSGYYEDAELLGSIEISFEINGETVWIRDYELHKKLLHRGFIEMYNVAGLEEALKSQYPANHQYDVSQEIFTIDTSKQDEKTPEELTIELLQDCFEEIVEEAQDEDTTIKVYRREDDGQGKMVRHYLPTQNFELRDYQQEFVEKAQKYFASKYRENQSRAVSQPVNFLLSAPTRSGKSHMVVDAVNNIMHDLRGDEKGLVVVLSGIADVMMEWQAAVEQHWKYNQRTVPEKGATRMAFVHRDTLKVDENAVEKEYAKGADIVVVALTLQDLYGTFGEMKNASFIGHKFLKLDNPDENPVDLLVIDEAHYAAFTEGGAFKQMLTTGQEIDDFEAISQRETALQEQRIAGMTEQEKEEHAQQGFALENDKIEQTTKALRVLKPSIGTFYVSATPYNELAGGTMFSNHEGNLEIITKKQILSAAMQWDLENPDNLENSPFYGMVKTTFFGVDPGADIQDILAVDNNGNFVQYDNAMALIYNYFGYPYKGEFRFARIADDPVYRKAGLGNHTLLTVPYKATANAVEAALVKLSQEHLSFRMEVLNISPVEDSGVYRNMDAAGIKNTIAGLERQNKRTVTITVDRMMTGVTVKEWDTVVFWRTMSSAQKFEQAAGRAGSSFVITAKNEDNGDSFKMIEKPNAAVISYVPDQMVTVIHEMAKLMGGVVHNKERKKAEAAYVGDSESSAAQEKVEQKTVAEHMEDELTVTETYVLAVGGGHMVELTPRDILDRALATSAGQGLSKYARSSGVNTMAVLNSPMLREMLLSVDPMHMNTKLTERQFEELEVEEGKCHRHGCDEDAVESLKQQYDNVYCREHLLAHVALEEQAKDSKNKPSIGEAAGVKEPTATEQKGIQSNIQDYENRVTSVMTRLMFYVALSGTQRYELSPLLRDLNSLLAKDSATLSSHDRRQLQLIRNLELNVDILNIMVRDGALDYTIDTQLHHVQGIFNNIKPGDSYARINAAVNMLFKDFGRFSSNEVTTPPEVAAMLWDSFDLTADDFAYFAEYGVRILDPGAKAAVLVVRFLQLAAEHGLPKDKINFSVIPTSPVTYEVIRKMYELYELDVENILYIDGVSNLDMVNLLQTWVEETYGCQREHAELCSFHGKSSSSGTFRTEHGVSGLRYPTIPKSGATESDYVKIQDYGDAVMEQTVDTIFGRIQDSVQRSAAMRKWEIMKNDLQRFDYAISNPPYQDDGNSAIFHVFQVFSDAMAKSTSLVYPADKWLTKSGKGVGLDVFSNEQVNSPRLSNLTIYEDANSLFSGIELHGGISIVTKQSDHDNGGYIDSVSYDFDMQPVSRTLKAPGERTLSLSNNMNAIVEKSIDKAHHGFLDSVVFSTSEYGIGSSFIEKSSTAIPDNQYNGEAGYTRVLANGTSGTQGRVGWFWVKTHEVPKLPDSIEKYVVAISTRHAAGYGGRSQQARIFKPGEIFGDSRFGVAAFDTQEEADNFFRWMGTDVIRTLIVSSSRRIKNFGTNVPLLSTYLDNDGELDFTGDINNQLIQLYGLDSNDILYIGKTIESFGAFAMVEQGV